MSEVYLGDPMSCQIKMSPTSYINFKLKTMRNIYGTEINFRNVNNLTYILSLQ